MRLMIEIEQEADGRIIAEVAELPGALAYGRTREEAIARAKALALRVLADRLEQGEAVPEMVEVFSVSVSQATTLERIGEFWDSHDFTDFDTDAPDVVFTTSHAIQIEADLLAAIEKQARLRGVNVETLVNLWLQQKLAEETPSVAA